MTYSATAIPNSAGFTGGLLINDAAMLVWEAGLPRDLYLYRPATSLTTKISTNSGDGRAGCVHHLNAAGTVVWDTVSASSYVVMRYDGLAAQLLNVGGQSCHDPDLNDNELVVLVRYGWWQNVFECHLATWFNGQYSKLLGWPGSRYAVLSPRINGNGQIAYVLFDGEVKTYEVHLYANQADKVLGGPYGWVGDVDLNSHGWVLWANTKEWQANCVGIYLFDGTETRKISPSNAPLPSPSFPHLNNAGKVVYEAGTCDQMDIFLYAEGITQKLDALAPFNYHPQIDTAGQIVWWGSSEWDSLATGCVYGSFNGAPTEKIADSGAYPVINDPGHIAYWDANAGQIVLLTPSSLFFSWRRLVWAIRSLIRRIWTWLKSRIS